MRTITQVSSLLLILTAGCMDVGDVREAREEAPGAIFRANSIPCQWVEDDNPNRMHLVDANGCVIDFELRELEDGNTRWFITNMVGNCPDIDPEKDVWPDALEEHYSEGCQGLFVLDDPDNDDGEAYCSTDDADCGGGTNPGSGTPGGGGPGGYGGGGDGGGSWPWPSGGYDWPEEPSGGPESSGPGESSGGGGGSDSDQDERPDDSEQSGERLEA